MALIGDKRAASTDKARRAIGGVAVAIGRVHEATDEIVASIKQQSAARREIAPSVQSVASLTEVTTQAMGVGECRR